MRSAVILAGGKGSRLASRLLGRPKPLVEIDGAPLIGRQLAALRLGGFATVAILVNHESEQIRRYCAAHGDFGLTLDFIDDGEQAKGTSGAVLAALDRLEPRFLVVYGDTLFNIDLDRFWCAHEASGAAATLFLHPNDHLHDSDIVEIDSANRIVAFHSAPHPPHRFLPNLVSAAMYVIERGSLKVWRDLSVPNDFGRQLFPAMVSAGATLLGYRSFEYIKDVGTPDRLDKAVRELRSGVVARASYQHRQRAVYLDRDGTLNRLSGHIRSPERLELFPWTAVAIKRLNDAEYRTLIVTNQPVVARGECSFETLTQIHAKLETDLSRMGAFVDGIFFCPHHPDKGYANEIADLKIKCRCRKPAIGLIEEAEQAFNVDREQSWLIGDATSDIEAARLAGLRSVLVRTGEGGLDGKYKVTPDFVADNLADAVELILAQSSHRGCVNRVAQ